MPAHSPAGVRAIRQEGVGRRGVGQLPSQAELFVKKTFKNQLNFFFNCKNKPPDNVDVSLSGDPQVYVTLTRLGMFPGSVSTGERGSLVPSAGTEGVRGTAGPRGSAADQRQQSPVWSNVSKHREPGSWLSLAFSWRPALRPGRVSQASSGWQGSGCSGKPGQPRGRQQRLHESHLVTASGLGSHLVTASGLGSHLVTASGLGSQDRGKSQWKQPTDRVPGWGEGRRMGAPDPVPEGSPACKSSVVPGWRGFSSAPGRGERSDHGFSLGHEAPQPGPAGGSHSLPRPLQRLQFQEREEKVPLMG